MVGNIIVAKCSKVVIQQFKYRKYALNSNVGLTSLHLHFFVLYQKFVMELVSSQILFSGTIVSSGQLPTSFTKVFLYWYSLQCEQTESLLYNNTNYKGINSACNVQQWPYRLRVTVFIRYVSCHNAQLTFIQLATVF